MGTKENPSRHDGYRKAEPNEPVFTLLGRDPFAGHLIREWAVRRQQAGDHDAAMEALAVAADMEKFYMQYHNRPRAPELKDEG